MHVLLDGQRPQSGGLQELVACVGVAFAPVSR